MHNLEGMAVFINITDEENNRPYSTIPGRDSKIQNIDRRLKKHRENLVPLYLFKDGLPACSTAEKVSQEPWKILPTANQVTANPTCPPITPERRPESTPSPTIWPGPYDFNGTSATKFSIIFSSVCVLFNLIRF